MRKALMIDCCIRGEQSQTRKLLEQFTAALPACWQQERLLLEEENLSCLTGAYFQARERLLAAGKLEHPRFRYAHQLAQAELVVVAAPFWDLSFPALLKVYIEQVCVDGITFGSGHGGLVGLCRAKDLVFLTTRGGIYTGDDMEMGSRYMEAMSRFWGIDHYHCVAVDGMNMSRFHQGDLMQRAAAEAEALAKAL